jgi:pyruvate formate lyase activating enzyme
VDDNSVLGTMNLKKEALLYKKGKSAIICRTCEKKCRITPEKPGFCQTRNNINGELFTNVYGKIASISANPIEKKPLFHFYPGTTALTVGTFSCNFTCPWCQNYGISKSLPYKKDGDYISPERFIRLLELYNCKGTSISLNEPTLLFEYSLDVFQLARAKGYYNTYVSNGYMTIDVLKMLIDAGLDAINIDIKGDTSVYKKFCNADAKYVWRNVSHLRKNNIWLELTTLLIPDVNDSEKQLREIVKIIKEETGTGTPWHISRYHPAWEFNVPATPIQSLECAYEIGKDSGLNYIYIGNVPGHKYANTYCPGCGELLIKRTGFEIKINELIHSNKCPKCHFQIPHTDR